MPHTPPRNVLVAALVLVAPLLIDPRNARAQSANPAPIQILATAYKDLDGDLDPFPDTGETGRVTVTLKNTGGQSLTGITFNLVSTDADVSCITEHAVSLATMAAGEVTTIGSLTAGPAGFTFRASDLLSSTSSAHPATIDLCLIVTANEIDGLSDPLCFRLLADLNLPPGASQTFTLGPDGLAGTADDGTVVENFDTDRDGQPDFSLEDLFKDATAPGVYTSYCSSDPSVACSRDADCPAPACDGGSGVCTSPGPVAGRACATNADCGGAPVCYKASYVRGSAPGSALGTVAGITCGGFDDPAFNPQCVLDPAFPMDWHFHCPAGATNCPNADTPPCVAGTGFSCSFNTPATGNKAHSLPNSLHMGAHYVPTDSLAGDTTHLRTLQGFMTTPINLAAIPRIGDLEMSFFHIARLMDNNGVGPNNQGKCADCGDVQVQIDTDPDPGIDSWGTWDKLVPFQNVYDHKPDAWSTFGSYYCVFTPTDTGTAPPSPKGVHETICWPQGAWSHCGSTTGTTPASTVDCPGPGEVDPSGVGVWVQTKFDLSAYLGQRIRIRWIAETWNFGAGGYDYYEFGSGWDSTTQDDGWWIDDIRVSGSITRQITPVPDTAPPPATSCTVHPDLVEAALADPPASVQAGGSLTLSDTAANLGDDNAAGSVTGFYLSLDTSKDTSDLALGNRTVGPLASGGGTSQGSVTATVPAATPRGHYYLLACADDTGLVAESSETNNCRASKTTVQVLVGLPDLVESALSDPPAAASAGSPITVTDTVTNQGVEDAGSSLTRFYLSVDTSRDAGDTPLGTRSVGAVPAGGSSSGSVPVTVPGGTAAGPYFLIACADDDGQVAETDETNNCRTSVTQMLVTKADLVESAVPNPPAKVLAGTSFQASDTATNLGNGGAGASTTRYYLALGTARAAGDIPLGTRAVEALAPGASSTGNGTASVPVATAGGNYYLIACADDDGQVPESSETNNCLASARQTLVTKPDLAETAVQNPPTSVTAGSIISVSDTARNVGNGDADSSVTRYFLSLDTVKDGSDIALGSRIVGPLAVNKSSSGTVSVTVPTSAGGGISYYLLACADDDAQVVESNETNNCHASNKQVRVN